MKAYRLFYLIIVVMLASCVQKKNSDEGKASIESLQFEELKSKEAPDLNYKLSFIKLQTSDSCLIDKVNQIESKNDTLFILDSSTSRLLAFNKTGSYINTIGERGNAPGEYIFPISFSLSNDKSELHVVDAGQQKLIKYDSYTFEYIDEQKLGFDTSCGFPLDGGEKWIWNDRGYQSKENECFFLTTDTDFVVGNHYIEKEFKSGYIMGPSVPMYKAVGKTYGYIPFSSVIYEISAEGISPVYNVEYGHFKFPSVAYMNEISNHGSDPYFDKLSQSGYISYNMLSGNAHGLLACFMVDDVKYIGFYHLKTGKSDSYKLDDFAELLKCGQFDYVSSSIESFGFIFPLSSNSLKMLEMENYEFNSDLKALLAETSKEDNPILCVVNI